MLEADQQEWMTVDLVEQDRRLAEESEQSPLTPYARGYKLVADARRLLKAAYKVRFSRSCLASLGDLAMLFGLALAGAAVAVRLKLGTLPVTLVLVFAMARYLRGLECLVHEASHCNWNRRRSVNDAFANVLAALPVFSRVAPYRRQHLVHHALLGTDLDPDLVRYRQFDLESLDRSGVRRFTLEIVARLPRYTKEWFGAIGTDRATLLLSLLWHGLVNLTVALVFGVDYAVLFATHWVVAFVVCLPIIRIIAESSEHRYSDAKTVLGSTVSNLGWIHRLIFHPHWDGHHVIHHLWPAVPHHRLNALHNDLLRVDPDNYAKGLRFRTRVLEQPATVPYE